MFTGLIRHLGEITSLNKGADILSICVESPQLALITHPKDSISVNGLCLTISEVDQNKLYFDLVQETIDRSTAKKWKIGQVLHLEPAMRLGDRLDGHLVSGHVDGVVKVLSVEKRDESKVISFSLPENLSGYVIEKGSVTIDGVSLTVASNENVGSDNELFTVWLIPTTLQNTNLDSLNTNDEVNLEVDLIGKYVLKNIKRSVYES
jgi:riboflavin synthase